MWLFLAACKPVPDVGEGILGTGLANPFPTAEQLDASGHLALHDLPDPGRTDLPVDRLAWRTGFSPAQVSVLHMPGIDPSGFPSFQDIEPGEGSIRMVDLTDGVEVPCFAELDAYPDAVDPVTLIRPLQALGVGHRIAVVVTTDAIPRPERFDLLISKRPPESLKDIAPAYRQLVEDLGVYGFHGDDIAIAWEFPVGDGTAPLVSALAQHEVPGTHAFTSVREVGQVQPLTYRAAEGTFGVTNFLIDDLSLDLDADGGVAPVGTADAYVYVHIPESVADAPAGSVPVMVFGHGLLSDPKTYLDADDDWARVMTLADELGVIVLATKWRGLTSSDLLGAVNVTADFGRFHEITDRLVQGQVNVRTLIEYAKDGDLLDDPVFQGASGQKLADPTRVLYYGISLGAIEGMVMWAHDPPVDHAVFHVGGAMWSTMLERSSNWSQFETLLVPFLEDPAVRQDLYAVTQLWWDPVDPFSYVDALASRDFLLQESVNDEQVPNLATEALARSIPLAVLDPVEVVPFGLDTTQPGGQQALSLFDPRKAPPAPTNRPAETTEAHTTPRTWLGQRLQVEDYLNGLGVQHHCGDAMCTAENTGD